MGFGIGAFKGLLPKIGKFPGWKEGCLFPGKKKKGPRPRRKNLP